MKSLEIWSEMKDEASTFGKTDTDASVFLNAYIDPFETLGSALSFKLSLSNPSSKILQLGGF